MVEIYKTDNKVLQKLDNIEEGCWVNMIDPTSSELSLVSGYFEIDLADLATALDEEESSRISLEDGYTLILVDIPTPEVRHEKKMYTTIRKLVCINPVPRPFVHFAGIRIAQIKYEISHVKMTAAKARSNCLSNFILP